MRNMTRIRKATRRGGFGARRSDDPNWRSKPITTSRARQGVSWKYANTGQRVDRPAQQQYRERVRCAYCARHGHVQRECELREEHREQMQVLRQDQQRQRSASCSVNRHCTETKTSNPKCTYCGKIGHTKGYCGMRFGHNARKESLKQEHWLQRTSRKGGEQQDKRMNRTKRRRSRAKKTRRRANRRGTQ